MPGSRIDLVMTDTGTSPKLGHLPLQEWGFDNCPAIPFWADANGDPDLEACQRRR